MGILTEFSYTKEGLCQTLHPPPPTFDVGQIPDLTGRVIIVTGGYAGIGKETTKVLLERNAKVYVASRNRSKAEAAFKDLKEQTGREPTFLQLDLADLHSRKRALEEFMQKENALHILFNNAGVMWVDKNETTADGYDLQFGTNALGHWYFTELLMPALLRGKESSPDGYARVITTSSSAAYSSPLYWDTFKDSPERKKLSTYTLYNQSKLANVIVAREITRRYGSKGIISISVNPGSIKSELQRHVGTVGHWFIDHLAYPTPMGALTQLYAGTMPEAIQHNGEFMVPWARVSRCRDEAYDPEIATRLWAWMEDQVKDLQTGA